MKLFVTGATGLLGSAFARAAIAAGNEVIGSRFRSDVEVPGVRTEHLDLTSEPAVVLAITAAEPDAIVNCAAATAIAECERDPVSTHRINVELPRLLARLAAASSARLIHISSEQVFDGTRTTPYAAGDSLAPLNAYGRQKAESERLVLHEAAGLAVVIRAPLLLGDSLSGRRGLHEQLVAAWASGNAPTLLADEYRQPCHVDNLSAVMLELLGRRDLSGIFHWAGLDRVSRYELGVRIRDSFQLPAAGAPLVPHWRESIPDVARVRPQFLQLDISPLARQLQTRAEPLAAALRRLHLPPLSAEWQKRLH